MAFRERYVRGGEFVCNRDLDFTAHASGRVFKIGERLPWRDLGIHEVTLYQWWQQNMIEVAPAVVAAPVAPVVMEPKPKPHHQHRR